MSVTNEKIYIECTCQTTPVNAHPWMQSRTVYVSHELCMSVTNEKILWIHLPNDTCDCIPVNAVTNCVYESQTVYMSHEWKNTVSAPAQTTPVNSVSKCVYGSQTVYVSHDWKIQEYCDICDLIYFECTCQTTPLNAYLQMQSRTVYISNELCMSVTNEKYCECTCQTTPVNEYLWMQSRTVYVGNKLCMSVTNERYCECTCQTTPVNAYLWMQSRTVYMGHKLCIWVTNKRCMYTMTYVIPFTVNASAKLHLWMQSRTVYMGYELCTWVTNKRILWMHLQYDTYECSHELCISVTNCVYGSRMNEYCECTC